MGHYVVLDAPTKEFLSSLRSLRKAAGLTQEKLAKAAGISKASLQSYEIGRYAPHLERLLKLAECLGYDLSSSLNYKKYHGQLGLSLSSKLQGKDKRKKYKYRMFVVQDGPTKKFLSSLRSLRQAAGLTCSELAEAVGISLANIQDYERGRSFPILLNLIKLADYFGYDLSSSVNYKFFYGKLDLSRLRILRNNYGLSLFELADMTSYHFQQICKTLRLKHGGGLGCLSAIQEVLCNEQARAAQRGR